MFSSNDLKITLSTDIMDNRPRVFALTEWAMEEAVLPYLPCLICSLSDEFDQDDF